MTAMRLKRYPSPSGGIALGKMGVGVTMLRHILPAGARWVEYLQSTGTQYIDTGIVASYAASIAIDMSVVLTSLRGASASTFNLFGGNTAFNNGISIGCDSANSTVGFRCTNGSLVQTNVFPEIGLVYNFHLDDNKFSVNNTVFGFTRTNTGFVSRTTLLFGIRREDSVQTASLSSCRMESCKMYSSGVLVRDFRPIAIGNTGYMLDLVTGDYLQYGNKGTGDDFVIGPDINAPAI